MMGWKLNPVHVRRIEGALQPQLRWLANRERVSVNMRLRTKFLLSLVLIIAGLTFSTLLIVGHAAQEQVQKALEQDTRNSVGTFQNVRNERQIELNRDAEILATLPSIKSIMADESPVSDPGSFRRSVALQRHRAVRTGGLDRQNCRGTQQDPRFSDKRSRADGGTGARHRRARRVVVRAGPFVSSRGASD